MADQEQFRLIIVPIASLFKPIWSHSNTTRSASPQSTQGCSRNHRTNRSRISLRWFAFFSR